VNTSPNNCGGHNRQRYLKMEYARHKPRAPASEAQQSGEDPSRFDRIKFLR
jgi:hypothetical protein